MKFARALRRTAATRCCAEELPALPDEVEQRASAERTLEVDGETVTLDELGPIVVSKDGKLGHLSNWHEMTESEQAAALKFVAARNAKRRAALLKNRGGAVSANLLPTVLAAAIVCAAPSHAGAAEWAPTFGLAPSGALRACPPLAPGESGCVSSNPKEPPSQLLAPLRHGSLDREGAYRRLRSQLLASDGVALIDEDGGAYLRARYADGDDAEYRVTDDAVSFRVVAQKPTKAKPFCAQVGCVNGNEAQRARVLRLRDDLGWSSLDAEYEAEKRWVPIFLH